MINYNTQRMHTTGKNIQKNGQQVQSDLQLLWSLYQTDMQCGFPIYTSSLLSFMDRCKNASHALAQNRIDIGTQLDRAATAAEQTDTGMQRMFMHDERMMP